MEVTSHKSNPPLRVDSKLQLGQASDEVIVASDAIRVEPQGMQIGVVIEGRNGSA